MQFPADSGFEGGACARGLAASHLLRSDARIYEASVDGRPMVPEDALEAVADMLGNYEASEVAVMLDAYRPLETLSRAAELVSAALPKALLCTGLPPGDPALLDAGLAAEVAPVNLEECDLVLALGDPFSTHPPVSRHLRNMQLAERGNRLLVVSSAVGRTGLGADRCMTVHPGRLAALTCALAVECGANEVSSALGGADADAICDESGVPPSMVEELAGALDEADTGAVVLANPAGYCCRPHAVVRGAAEAARESGARLHPLYASPNASAAAEIGRMPPVLKAMRDGRVRAAVVLGFDPMGRMAPAVWGEAAEELEFVVHAAPVRTRFAREADALLPLALPWEESGTLGAVDGGQVRSSAWASLPEGVVSMDGLLEGLAYHLGADASASGRAESPEPRPVPVERVVGEDVLEGHEPADGCATMVAEPQVYADGNTAWLEVSSWTRRMAGSEAAVMGPGLAEELGLQDGEPVSLGDDRVVLDCEVREGMPDGVVAVPSHRESVRSLLHWHATEDVISVGPAEVEIRSAE